MEKTVLVELTSKQIKLAEGIVLFALFVSLLAGFGLLCLAAWLFICIWIPETKGRSLEEIEKQLLKKE